MSDDRDDIRAADMAASLKPFTEVAAIFARAAPRCGASLQPELSQASCPGHVASEQDAKVCGLCGIYIAELALGGCSECDEIAYDDGLCREHFNEINGQFGVGA